MVDLLVTFNFNFSDIYNEVQGFKLAWIKHSYTHSVLKDFGKKFRFLSNTKIFYLSNGYFIFTVNKLDSIISNMDLSDPYITHIGLFDPKITVDRCLNFTKPKFPFL